MSFFNWYNETCFQVNGIDLTWRKPASVPRITTQLNSPSQERASWPLSKSYTLGATWLARKTTVTQVTQRMVHSKASGAARQVTRMSVPLLWVHSSPPRPNASCFRARSSSGTSRCPCGTHSQDSNPTPSFLYSTTSPTLNFSPMGKSFKCGTEKIWQMLARPTTMDKHALKSLLGICKRNENLILNFNSIY